VYLCICDATDGDFEEKNCYKSLKYDTWMIENQSTKIRERKKHKRNKRNKWIA
jgi:hypothetical protein